MSNVKDPSELCIHHYESDEWTIEIYNNVKALYYAKRTGMIALPSKYDGDYFRCTTLQMAYFLRLMSGESVRVPKNVRAAGGSDSVGNKAIELSPQSTDESGRQKRKRRTRRNVQKEA